MSLDSTDVVAMATQYFRNTRDRQSRIIVFSDTRPPLQYQGARRFGSPGRGITVFEQFGGRTPLVLSHEFLIERRTFAVAMRPTILLDSHVIGLLQRYLRPVPDGAAPNADRDADRAAAHEFLRFAVQTNYDYNPTFAVTVQVLRLPG